MLSTRSPNLKRTRHCRQVHAIVYSAVHCYRESYARRGIVAGLPLAGFCDPMRLSDFIDFISVERVKEKTTT